MPIFDIIILISCLLRAGRTVFVLRNHLKEARVVFQLGNLAKSCYKIVFELKSRKYFFSSRIFQSLVKLVSL